MFLIGIYTKLTLLVGFSLALIMLLRIKNAPGKDCSNYTHGTATSSVEIIHAEHLYNSKPLYKEFNKLASTKTAATDLKLIELAKKLLDPPAVRKFKRSGIEKPWTPLESIAFDLLGNISNGFYVEAGAYDGQTASNTLHLEQEKGWKGLLIEADPDYYLQIRGHNRHAWSINAGIGVHSYAEVMGFWEDWQGQGGQGGMLNTAHKWKMRRTGEVKTLEDRNEEFTSRAIKSKGIEIPCFPLETLLIALDQRRVDYLSLDVEGKELEVLKTIPFEKFDIKVLSVEYSRGGKDAAKRYSDFMKTKGYKLHRKMIWTDGFMIWVHDLIFVKE